MKVHAALLHRLRHRAALERYPSPGPWPLRMCFENPTIENIDPCVHEASGIAIRLFREATHAPSAVTWTVPYRISFFI